MFVCLSSGATPRYREDILRALAMPSGTRLQFRYDVQRWVAPVIRERLRRGDALAGPALIAYIDQQDNKKPPELVPCRFALLVEAVAHGTTVTLTLELRELAYAENLEAFNTEVRSLSANTLPTWQEDGRIRGSYWLEVGQNLTTVITSNAPGEWEKVVVQLAGRQEFSDEIRFYMIREVRKISDGSVVTVTDGRYSLAPGKDYEIQIYHFSPKKTPTGQVVAESAGEMVKLTRGTLVLDSRYDLKRLRFRTGKPPSSEDTVVTLTYRNGQESSLSVDINVTVGGTFRETLARGIVIGSMLALPQIIAAVSNPALPVASKYLVILVSVSFGLLTGIAAAFGLKKSV